MGGYWMSKIDLLLGGSPCQGFSIAGKRLNFDDPRSKLFFNFVDALKILKPKYYLAVYKVATEQFFKLNGQEIKASMVKNNHLLNILRFLEVPEMSGLLVRQIDEQYEFRPVIEDIDNGYNINLKKQEVLKFLQIKMPNLLPDKLKTN